MADDHTTDERKRYTSRLQRRAQAHVTAELGSESSGADVDRQVAMLVQHALETTGARRVTLFRPIARSQRWQSVTALDDGGFHYGLVAPDSLVLPMVAYVEKRSVLLSADRPHEIPAQAADLGFRSYLGLPLLVGETVVAVLEAVDVAQSNLLDDHALALEQTMHTLTQALDSERVASAGAPTASPTQGAISESSILDLVLRPPLPEDEPFEVAAEDWQLLAHVNGVGPLAAAATVAGLPTDRAIAIAAGLLERGLIRIGREDRRRA